MTKKIVFACDTPLQVLNAINLKETHFKEQSGDIFIYNQFQAASEIVEKLKDLDVFEDVYLVKKYKEYPSIIQKFVTLKRMLFPYRTLSKYVKNSITRSKYEFVAFSFITTFSLTVFGMAKTKKYLQLEDGMGTYVGDILNDYTSGLFKKIMINSRYNNITKPQCVCIYNPSMYEKKVPVLKLENNFSMELCKKIEHIYDYKVNDIYGDKRGVYLTQPFQETKGCINKNVEYVNDILRQYKDEFLFRIHPREKEGTYNGFLLDNYKNLWELECIHQVKDEHVLIGAFSTTQLMPKVLCDKEPFLIFLYKFMFKDTHNAYWTEISGFIENFKKFYRNSEKIYIPESVEEFERIIRRIVEIGDNNE